MSYCCDECNRWYETFQGLKEHWVQSPYHDYCQYCDSHFFDVHDAREHFREFHFFCDKCDRVFRNDFGLNEHYRQSPQHHFCQSCDLGFQNDLAFESHKMQYHYYCAECRKDFQSASNLEHHAQSHLPRGISCPMRGCNQGFKTCPGLVAHLESGRCPSRVDRATINRYVSQWDRCGVITDPSRLLTGGASDFSSNRRIISTIATDAAWNGEGFECYLCHKEFGMLRGLDQHLASPAHEDGIYHCPLSTCRRQFHVLSGLIAHIESQKCGVMKFSGVRGVMDDMFNPIDRFAIEY